MAYLQPQYGIVRSELRKDCMTMLEEGEARQRENCDINLAQSYVGDVSDAAFNL